MGNQRGSKARVAVAAASWDERHAAGEAVRGPGKAGSKDWKDFGFRVARRDGFSVEDEAEVAEASAEESRGWRGREKKKLWREVGGEKVQLHTVKTTVVVTEAAVEHRQWRGW